MADTGSGWEFFWPAKLWEHRVRLRRRYPIRFWSSVALLTFFTVSIALILLRDATR